MFDVDALQIFYKDVAYGDDELPSGNFVCLFFIGCEVRDPIINLGFSNTLSCLSAFVVRLSLL